MTRGVCYMLVGGKHGPMLVVSVFTLRQWYDGPVALIAGDPQSEEVAQLIHQDPRSGDTQVVRWDAPVGGGKGLQHANKTHVADLCPFDEFVFLDADTMITGDIEELFPRPGEEVVLSQFANWHSTDRKIRNRTEPWREFAPEVVSRSQAERHPAINTGTFGLTKQSTDYTREWKRLSRARPSFMCDEIVAQLIHPDFDCRVVDERWNCSPIYSWPRYAPPGDADVRVWHGHGWKFISRIHGNHLWMPAYRAAFQQGFARLNEWAPGKDKRLAKVLKNGGPKRRA